MSLLSWHFACGDLNISSVKLWPFSDSLGMKLDLDLHRNKCKYNSMESETNQKIYLDIGS